MRRTTSSSSEMEMAFTTMNLRQGKSLFRVGLLFKNKVVSGACDSIRAAVFFTERGAAFQNESERTSRFGASHQVKAICLKV